MSFQSTVLGLSTPPIRYYRLNDNQGGTTIHDLGSQAQDGTLHNGPGALDQGLINGDLTNSMHFLNSVYASLPTTGLPTGASPFTIGCVVRLRGVPVPGNYPCLVNIGAAGNNNNAGIFFNGDDTKIETAGIVVAGNNLKQLTAVKDGFIYNAFVTYDGTTAKLYVNGVLQQSGAVALNLSYGSALIGLDVGGTLYWRNHGQEVMIFNYALSATQISSLNTAAIAGGSVATQPTEGQGIYEDCDPTDSAAFSRLDNIAAGGFKTVLNYALLSAHTHIADVIAYINHAASVGLKVIVSLHYTQIWQTPAIAATFPLLYSDSGNQSTVSGFDTYIVNQTKALAGTWGYYVADEPGAANHAACKTHADAIKAATTKPRLLVESGENVGDGFWQSGSPFFDCCDVGGDDIYPVGDDKVATQNPTITVASGNQAYCTLNSIQSALVLQALDWNQYGTPPCTPAPQCAYFPYSSQMKQQLVDTLANMTARLVLWYSYHTIFGSGTISSQSVAVPGVSHWSDLTSIINPAKSGASVIGNGRFARIG